MYKFEFANKAVPSRGRIIYFVPKVLFTIHFEKILKEMVKGSVLREGDEFIFFVSHDELVRVTLKNGSITQCRAGKFRHKDIIGKEMGARVSYKSLF